MRALRILLVGLLGVMGCQLGQSDESSDGLEHHECPVPAPLLCDDMAPEGFDAPAECAARVPGSWACPFQGNMCSGDGCESYPPDGEFIEWYLCDGLPVELWCCGASPAQ